MQDPSQIAIRDYTYELPPEKIAQHPLADREASKLLVWRKGTISEDVFKNLLDYLPEASTLVFNTTRVVNARLSFFTTLQQHIEIFCLGPDRSDRDPMMEMQQTAAVTWRCFVGHLKRWKENRLVAVRNGTRLYAQIAGREQDVVRIHFSWEPVHLSFSEVLEQFGEVPIPPYLKRESETSDKERYQTVYAHKEGSVAAPTAGLHFTPRLLSELKKRSVGELRVTLHVGAGTFKPVKSATMKEHEMHAEWMEVSRETIFALCNERPNVIAVGTTSLRTLESLYWMGYKTLQNPEITIKDLELKQWDVYAHNAVTESRTTCLEALINWMDKNSLSTLICQTQILIAPPYQLKVATGLITNFHQPQSTLLLLVAAILGQNWRKVYDYALHHEFRFLSYGDSSLLLK